ncbi:MAG: VOC family protein, partial [Chitinophagaceae bacterium]
MTNDTNSLAEFRFGYTTSRYPETVNFYKNTLGWEVFRSWDRGPCQKGTIVRSPNGVGLIEIEEGTQIPVFTGELYIEVEDVDGLYESALSKNITIV